MNDRRRGVTGEAQWQEWWKQADSGRRDLVVITIGAAVIGLVGALVGGLIGAGIGFAVGGGLGYELASEISAAIDDPDRSIAGIALGALVGAVVGAAVGGLIWNPVLTILGMGLGGGFGVLIAKRINTG